MLKKIFIFFTFRRKKKDTTKKVEKRYINKPKNTTKNTLNNKLIVPDYYHRIPKNNVSEYIRLRLRDIKRNLNYSNMSKKELVDSIEWHEHDINMLFRYDLFRIKLHINHIEDTFPDFILNMRKETLFYEINILKNSYSKSINPRGLVHVYESNMNYSAYDALIILRYLSIKRNNTGKADLKISFFGCYF